MEDSFNEKESLQLITGMINKAKNNFSESGMLYLVWGFAILFCSLAQFVLGSMMGYKYVYYIWFLTWPVYFYQAIFLYKKKKKATVKTYTDEIIGYVWICFIICFAIMMFILIYSRKVELIYSAVLVMYGIPTFLSGAILKVKSLVSGGIFCWALACISLFVPYNYHLLLISAAVVVAWIVPGYFLRNKYLTESKLLAKI